MKKVQLSPDAAAQDTAVQGNGKAGRAAIAAAKKQLRQQTEELRLKVLDLAERRMDITVQVLKRWLQAD